MFPRIATLLVLLLPVLFEAAVANQQGRLIWQESSPRSSWTWTTVSTIPRIISQKHEAERSRRSEPDLRIEVVVVDQTVTLNLFATRPSVSPAFVVRTFEVDGTMTTTSQMQNCLYTGYAGNVDDNHSFASVNYCNDGQLNGFWSLQGVQYTISPRSPRPSKRHLNGAYEEDHVMRDSSGNVIHYVSRAESGQRPSASCGTTTGRGSKSMKRIQEEADSVATGIARAATSSEAAQNATAVTVNIFVILDQSMAAIYGSDATNWGTQVINAASQLLANGNANADNAGGFNPQLQLELVGIDVWRSNQVAVTPNGPRTLELFCRWAMEQGIDYDVALLLTYVDIAASNTDIVGIAYLETACTKAGCALVEDLGPSALSLTSQTVIHEVGHTLGALHDGLDNNCPAGQFIMSAVQSDATQWSSCSIREINSYVSSSFVNSDFCSSMPININEGSALLNTFGTLSTLFGLMLTMVSAF